VATILMIFVENQLTHAPENIYFQKIWGRGQNSTFEPQVNFWGVNFSGGHLGRTPSSRTPDPSLSLSYDRLWVKQSQFKADHN